jgi:hypothetical protein
MSFRISAALTAALAATLLAPVPVAGQVRASELGTVGQTIDGTVIAIEYSRPKARGRDPLFGGVVHWGEHWTPGANWATTFEVSQDIHLNGHPVAAGKYSVWMVVQPDEWVVYLDPKARAFHTDPPDSTEAQIRFAVVPEERPFLETMTMWFPDVSATGATLATQWGTTYVPMEITVEPSRPITLAADAAEAYMGSYRLTWTPDPNAEEGEADGPREAEFEVYYENGSLMARMDAGPPWFRQLVLIEIADDWFNPGILDEDGQLYDVMAGLTLEFDVESGRAKAFDLRWITDEVIASAERQDSM